MFKGLDSLLNAEFPAGEPGGAVLVMKGDSTVYLKCSGLADLVTGEKIQQNEEGNYYAGLQFKGSYFGKEIRKVIEERLKLVVSDY